MSDNITFTLDGETVTAKPGETIWEVAHGRGFLIPHLCHKPCLLYTSPSPRDKRQSRMPSSA